MTATSHKLWLGTYEKEIWHQIRPKSGANTPSRGTVQRSLQVQLTLGRLPAGIWAGEPWLVGMLDGCIGQIGDTRVPVISPGAHIGIKTMLPVWNSTLRRRQKTSTTSPHFGPILIEATPRIVQPSRRDSECVRHALGIRARLDEPEPG